MRAYVEKFDSRFKDRSDELIRRRLGIENTTAAVRPLFTSYQMMAFKQSAYPYTVKSDDPIDVIAWR